MRNFRLRAPVTLPRDLAPGRVRPRSRPPAAVRRATAVRHRGQLAAALLAEERFGAWLVQGGIIAAMLGIVVFFRVPLMAAVMLLL